METEDKATTRAPKKILRVTFKDGTVICYKNVTTTYIEALRKIGVDNIRKVNLEIGHLPLLTKVPYPQYEDYMKGIGGGWYVNVQSDSSQKYMQLMSIKNIAGLDFDVEIGEDIVPVSSKQYVKSRQSSESILVRLPDATYIGARSAKDVYVQTLKYMGLELIRQKCLEFSGKECVTRFKKYNGQIQTDDGYWITLPNSTKDKVKAIEFLSTRLKAGLTVSLV